MKRLLKIIICALLALGMSASALAELQQGDWGDDVRALQRLLIQGQWLNNIADGSYGPRTEDAVKAYQRALGLEETGVADDQLIAWLEAGIRTPEELAALEAAQDAADDVCHSYVDDEGYHTSYCAIHTVMLDRCDALEEIGTADMLAMASQLWLDEIDRLYNVWMAGSEGAGRLAVMSAIAAWKVEASAQRAGLEVLLGDDADELEAQWLIYVRNHAVSLCAASK